MRIIKELADMIDEELEGACNYIKCALKHKDEHPNLSKVFYELSLDEMGHVNKLHNEVTRIIETQRREQGEPPEAMLILYNYIHEKQIDKATKVRMYQDQYKNY